MIEVEGYKAFCGNMSICPTNPNFPAFVEHGKWLYKPDTGCWYGNGHSFVADICEVLWDEECVDTTQEAKTECPN